MLMILDKKKKWRCVFERMILCCLLIHRDDDDGDEDVEERAPSLGDFP